MKCVIVLDASSYSFFNKSTFENHDLFAWSVVSVGVLRKAGVNYKTLSDITVEELNITKIYDSLKLYQNFCEQLDNILFEYLPILKDENIRPFQSRLHSFRKDFYQYFNIYEKLKTISGHYEEVAIYFPDDDSHQELLNIVNIVKDQLNLKVHSPEKKSLYKIFYPDWFYQRNWIRSCIRFFVREFKTKGLTSYFSAMLRFPLKKGDWGLVLGHAFDSDLILTQLRTRKGVNLLFWEDLPSIRKSKRLAFDEAAIVKDVKSELVHHQWIFKDGISFLDLFIPGIKKILKEDVQRMYDVATNFSEINKKFNFKFIFTCYALAENDVIFDQADVRSIPTVLALHGGSLGIYDGLVPIPTSLRNFKNKENSYYILYSEEIEKFVNDLREEFPTFTVRPKVTGSPYFEEL